MVNNSYQNINIAVFFSGWGRSVNTFLDLLQLEQFSQISLLCAITAGQDSGVVDRIDSMGIQIIDQDPKSFSSIAEYQDQLALRLKELEIDYIFLLGYKYRIRESLLSAFENRIINIHPSLLPSFKNTQSAIQDALSYGVKITGITAHIIDHNIDEGIIICQVAIPVLENDDYDSMDKKFMRECRNILMDTLVKLIKFHYPNQYLVAFISNK